MDNSFAGKLEFSLGAREQFDITLLLSAISKCEAVEKTDVETDKSGSDYEATLKGGARVFIDAKARESGASKYWKHGEPELALELWSVCPEAGRAGKIGWTLSTKSNVDLILYTFDRKDSDRYYLMPFQHLRMAFQRNGPEWVKRYGRKKQTSDKGKWKREACFVPASVVLNAVMAEMTGKA